MQFIDSGLLGLFVVMLFGVKGTGYDSQGLLFPVADLGCMNTVFSSQLIDRFLLMSVSSEIFESPTLLGQSIMKNLI